jgi:peptidyl-tRNA hydrolase
MSIAKTAAMAAHAAVGSYRKSLTRSDSRLLVWERTGETTVILEARDDRATCRNIKDYLEVKGYLLHRSHH